MPRIAREFLEAIILALVVFMVIQTSVQNFKVEGSSMDPTLEGGQYLLVNKLVYSQINLERLARMTPFWKVDHPDRRFPFHSPKRGEVIVFHFPGDPERDFVKRVVGLPGELVEIRKGTVFIDHNPMEEPYLISRDEFNMEQRRLGDKQYFVLGDNRRSSNDSRSWGPVPEENVVGKVWFVYWPVSRWEVLNGPVPVLSR
jgi:signal peptidase I